MMIGVPLAIDRDGSYVVAVVTEAVEELAATVFPEAVNEVEAAVEVEEEESKQQ